MSASTPKVWKLGNAVSLYKLMTNKKELSNFINFGLFEKEEYWDISKEKINLFNRTVRNHGKPRRERRQKMIASALEYSEQIFFLTEHPVNEIMEISKLIAVGISARTAAQISKGLQKKLRKYILPELEVLIDNRKFLIIPCFTLWDSGNNHQVYRKTQFITLTLIFLPHKIKSNPFPMEQMYKFINGISQPKLYGNHIFVLNTIKFQELEIDSNYYLFKDFFDHLVQGICKLFQAQEQDKEELKDYFQNQMMSFICHFSLENETCYVPNYSVLRKYTNPEKGICKLLSCFLYSFFWMENDPIKNKDPSIYDNIMNLSQDLILYLPHNVTAFFTEKRHLTLVAMHRADSFPDYSSIWTTGSEALAHEIFSIQLYLISFHTNILRDYHNEKNTDKLDIIREHLLDFEYLFNMETVDYDLNYRISRMQSKMGIQQRYQFLNQSVTTLSTLIREKENKYLQQIVIILSSIVLIVGIFYSSSDINMNIRFISVVIIVLFCVVFCLVILYKNELKRHWMNIKRKNRKNILSAISKLHLILQRG